MGASTATGVNRVCRAAVLRACAVSARLTATALALSTALISWEPVALAGPARQTVMLGVLILAGVRQIYPAAAKLACAVSARLTTTALALNTARTCWEQGGPVTPKRVLAMNAYRIGGVTATPASAFVYANPTRTVQAAKFVMGLRVPVPASRRLFPLVGLASAKLPR